MKIMHKLGCLVVLWLAVTGWAAAQDAADVGLVNQLAGKVTYGTGTNANLTAQAFMKVRQGDRIVLADGASLRVIYFASGRQETWMGPSSLRAGTQASEVLGGRPPQVSVLPSGVPQKMARLPDIVQGARLGGVVVRGAAAARPSSAASAEVDQARVTYRNLRGQATQEDVTPELYLLSVFQEHGYIDDMGAVAEEMLRRQPDTPEVRELAKWVQQRVNAPR